MTDDERQLITERGCLQKGVLLAVTVEPLGWLIIGLGDILNILNIS